MWGCVCVCVALQSTLDSRVVCLGLNKWLTLNPELGTFCWNILINAAVCSNTCAAEQHPEDLFEKVTCVVPPLWLDQSGRSLPIVPFLLRVPWRPVLAPAGHVIWPVTLKLLALAPVRRAAAASQPLKTFYVYLNRLFLEFVQPKSSCIFSH